MNLTKIMAYALLHNYYIAVNIELIMQIKEL